MNDPSLELVKTLFEQALELPPADRAGFLRRCQADEGAVLLALALLQEHQAAPEFLKDASPAEPSSDPLPGSIGGFRVIRVLGKGGMGVVYEAEQARPHRRVAIKVLSAHALSEQLLRRFENEAEILGRLQHPGIAQIYETGRACHGAVTFPYFAMELVAGVTLTRFAAERQLGVRARLALLAEVCEAVQHAHLKGVIHRDLKPANILVNAAGHPKVLDFGIARLTDSDVHATLATSAGQLVGTVPYMSPEQVQGDVRELDCRSDVYALGVIAFELLTGALPHDVRSRPLHEAIRVVRDEEPSRLSTLDRSFRGDLDTIIGKALQRDPRERYQSAESFASDLHRYLRDEPVEARPPSALYTMGKFAKRHRAVVGGACTVLLVLIVGIVLVSLSLQRALAAESDLQLQVKETGKRAAELEQLSQFQQEMLAELNPADLGARLTDSVHRHFTSALEAAGEGPAARASQEAEFTALWRRVNATDTAIDMIDSAILAPALATIARRFVDQPALAASLKQTVADSYAGLGNRFAAIPVQEDVLATRRRLLGDDDPRTIDSLNNLAVLFRDDGQLARALPLQREAVERYTRSRGPRHADTLGAMNSLAVLLLDLGETRQACEQLREIVRLKKAELGADDPSTLVSVTSLGAALLDLQQTDKALECFQEVLESRRRTLGNSDPSTQRSLNNLAGALFRIGRVSEAESLLVSALATLRTTAGSLHSDTLAAMNNLAYVQHAMGRHDEAEKLFREALSGQRTNLGESHADTLNSYSNLARLLLDRDDAAAALALLAQAEPHARSADVAGTFHRLGPFLVVLGRCQWKLGEFAAAERTLLEAHTVLDSGEAINDRDIGDCRAALVSLYEDWARADPAGSHSDKAMEWRKAPE